AGNLVLTALAEVTGSTVAALDHAAQLLRAAGRVLPLTTDRVDIVADVIGVSGHPPDELVEVRGQVAVATTTGRVVDVRLEPDSPIACPDAVRAVLDADVVVLGPGSLFTSVFPHLMVAELRAAIVKTAAQRIFTLNLVAQPGETSGFSPEAHIHALAAHAPELRLDHVVADESVLDRDGLMDAAATLGAEVHFAWVAAANGVARHDPVRLATAYGELIRHDAAAGG
ncbi:MAG: 2-phospho-L-lactate transferase CofD family protein, partial [Mycobacteriales bacterium]